MLSNKKLEEQFKLTDFYADMHDYKNMTQLALSSKIPKWKKIFSKAVESTWDIKQHLKKYCKQCEEPILFVHSQLLDSTGHYRDFRTHRIQFWSYYKKNLGDLWASAKEHYLATKEAHDNALKIHKEEHQKTEVVCQCGGKYSIRNKLKHFATQKHVKFCALNEDQC
jgi:hypothetical protein